MQSDMVQQILRRLVAAKPVPAQTEVGAERMAKSEARKLLSAPRARAPAAVWIHGFTSRCSRWKAGTRSARAGARNGFSERLVLARSAASTGTSSGKRREPFALRRQKLIGAAPCLRQARQRRRRDDARRSARSCRPDALTWWRCRGWTGPQDLRGSKALEARAIVVPTSIRSSARGFPSGSQRGSHGKSRAAARDTLQFLADCVKETCSTATQENQKLALAVPPGAGTSTRSAKRCLNVGALRRDQAQTEAMLSRERRGLARCLGACAAKAKRQPRVAVAPRRGEYAPLPRARTGWRKAGSLAEVCREAAVWGRCAADARGPRREEAPACRAALRTRARGERGPRHQGVVKGDAWDENCCSSGFARGLISRINTGFLRRNSDLGLPLVRP